MSRAAPKIKPRADLAKGYQSSQRPRNLVKLRAGDYCPPAGTPLAKPSRDLMPLGGIVFSGARKNRIRGRWINLSYLVAITVAMIGWLWLIAWTAMRLI
jgi:hypothetical protein